MEPTHKNNDCYFFYYSTCTKGDNCAFRHEASALGCETMCQYWQQGNCLNEHCNFRHMELKKNRKSIPCFWESQRGGCKKPHCPFLHLSGRGAPNADPANPIKTTEVTSKPVTQEWSNRPDDGKYDGSGTESDQGRGSSEAGSFIGSPAVDPLIVNFDEESDSESAPSPVKSHTSRVPYCKTYEEIRLEEIQAESAAYYSYRPDDYLGNIGGGKEKRVTSVRAARRMVSLYSREGPAASTTTGKTTTTTAAAATTTTTTMTTGESSKHADFTILTLEEIRRRKASQRSTESRDTISLSGSIAEIRKLPQRRKQTSSDCREETTRAGDTDDFLKNAIKTLAELKASSTSVNKIVSVVARKRKRDNDEFYTPEEKKKETDEDQRESIESETISSFGKTNKVPPIRLRRSPKRFARSFESTSMATSEMPIVNSIIFTKNDTSNSEEIEVRLCDSSTPDDIQTIFESNPMSNVRDKDADTLMKIVATEDLKLEQLCDTNLSSNDDEYLNATDPASEDILKDIDALLKEKSTV